jgi:hypothetical protein
MKPKRVANSEALRKLSEIYEKQGYDVVKPSYGRIEAYNKKTGRLTKVVVQKGEKE